MSYTDTANAKLGWVFPPELPDDDILQVRIDEAELALRLRIGDLATWVAAGDTELRAEQVKTVVRRVAQRAVRNPQGLKSEQSGDYGYSIDPRVASGTVWITDDDWALLGLPTSTQGRVGTIRLATGVRRRRHW